MAVGLNARAHVHAGRRQYDAAVADLDRALVIARATFGNDHQIVAIYSANLGRVHLEQGDAAAAEPLLREALRIRRLAPGIVPNRRRILREEEWRPETITAALDTALTGRRHR